jgi:hypothetical protein
MTIETAFQDNEFKSTSLRVSDAPIAAVNERNAQMT